jgi:hypothetical protein
VGVLCIAVGAPRSHEWHLLFGYRYLVFGVLALLAFARRREGNAPGWMALAGVATGIGLLFRLTPAFAAACGVGAGILAAGGGLRAWLKEGALYSAGLLAVVGPVALWIGLAVGFDTLWLEAVVRPVRMTELQSLPIPPLRSADYDVVEIFRAALFRLPWLLYGSFLAVLVSGALRGRRVPPVLLAFVVFGAVFFARTLGRSDLAHLESALPPAVLLAAVAASAAADRSRVSAGRAPLHPTLRAALACAVILGWAALNGVDEGLRKIPWSKRGPVLANSLARGRLHFSGVERLVRAVRRHTDPGDVLLDLTTSPGLHLLSGLKGPGWADVAMPGTFLSTAEELAFVARLEMAPPRLVLLPTIPFDRRPDRDLADWAPQVVSWVQTNYVPGETIDSRLLMVPATSPKGADPLASSEAGVTATAPGARENRDDQLRPGSPEPPLRP